MRRNLGFIAAWVAITTVSVLIASAAVGSVRGQVTDAPSPVRTATSALSAPTTSGSPDQTAPTTTAASPTTTTTSATTTSTTAPTTSTTTTQPPTTTSTTAPTTTTTTTQPATTTTKPLGDIRSYDTIGGAVTLLVAPGTVSLATAVPTPGFSVEEKDRNDPSKVVVEFESESHESKLEAFWSDGTLTVDIDEESEDD